MSRQVLILDSSQISTYLDCPQMHNLRYNENLTASGEVREDMAAGTYGHKLLEIYYKSLARGCPPNTAAAAAMHFHVNDDFPLSAERRKLVGERFNVYWMTYSHQDITVAMGNPRYSVSFDAAGDLIESFDPEPLVEQGFSYELLNDSSYLFVLEGRIDLLGRLASQTVWLDHKFQGRRHDLYKKSIQFRNYSLATNLTMGLVNYIRLSKEITKDTFVRDVVTFGANERRLWREELIEIYKKIAAEQASGHHTKNRASCSGKFSIPCEFTRICEEYSLVTVDAIKNTYFKKREPWSPW